MKDASGAWSDFIYANGQKIAMAQSGQTPHFYVGDHLGTAQLEFVGGGAPVWQGEFLPYGQEIDTNATANNFKFTSYERDNETGLDYAAARHYTSSFGRFMSPDPSGLAYADPRNPQSLNFYAYVQNNPLTNTDPAGLSCVTLTSADGSTIQGDDGDGRGCAAGNIAPDGTDLNQQQVNVNANPPLPPDPGLLQAGWDLVSTTAPGWSLNADNSILFAVLPKSIGRRPLSLSKPPVNRLFGTKYCGPGGDGSTRGVINGACAVHDQCYADANINADGNLQWKGVAWNNSQQAAAAKCNQALYDAARSNPNEPGSAALQKWLTSGSNTPFYYVLHPGTEAKPW
jgi:RHS repeat-associated protein